METLKRYIFFQKANYPLKYLRSDSLVIFPKRAFQLLKIAMLNKLRRKFPEWKQEIMFE